MTSTKYKAKERQGGFTIVELLIVIVVIGILATLTIVSYSGITSRANTVKAQTNASNAQKVADVYNADEGFYPATAADFATGSESAKMPSGATVIPGVAGVSGAFATPEVLSGTNGETKVAWSCLGTTTCDSPSTGGRIYYWNFSDQVVDTAGVIYVGDATATSTYAEPAS